MPDAAKEETKKCPTAYCFTTQIGQEGSQQEKHPRRESWPGLQKE